VNEFDHQGNSLLHQALLQAEEECAVFLVGVGADCVTENRDHQTPISLAVAHGYLLALGALLDSDRMYR
jgi:ankyrin repeat protein